MARRPNLSPIEGRIHLRRPVDRPFAFPLQSCGGPYILGKFIRKPASSQNWAEVYLQCGARIFRLPNCGVRERSGGTVVGSFKIAGSSIGIAAPAGRMKAPRLEIVISRL